MARRPAGAWPTTFYEMADWHDDGSMTIETPKRTRSPKKSGIVPGAVRRTGAQRRKDMAALIIEARKAAAQAQQQAVGTAAAVAFGRDTGLDPLRDRPDRSGDEEDPEETPAQRRRREAAENA